MNRILLTLTCCLFIASAQAQDEPRIKFIGLEGGAEVLLVEVLQYDNIRAEPGWYGDAEKNIQGSGSKFYTGIKAEVRSRNNKFGFSAGLRYTRLNTRLGKGYDSYYYGPTSDFFYFRVAQTENSIEYVRLASITDNSDYIGVPLGVSFSPFGERLFTFYFKAGLELNYRVFNSLTLEYAGGEIVDYDEVAGQLRSTRQLYGMFNTAAGFRFKPSKRLLLSLELGPSGFFSENISATVNTLGSFGGQLNIQFGL